MSDWISRLVTVALVGWLLWWLAGQYGLVNTDSAGSGAVGPAVKLTETRIEPPDVTKTYGDQFKGNFVVYNEGGSVAKGCTLWLLDGKSERFDLAPTAEKRVRFKSKSLYRKSGSAKAVVRIRCAGYEETLHSQHFVF